MGAQKLEARETTAPRFIAAPTKTAEVFDLDSHARAREALTFGIAARGIGFNIFVIGEDRSARMTATLHYLADTLATRPSPSDWIYLNNFRYPEHPTPYALPAGTGRRFCEVMAALIPRLREALAASFTAEAYQARVLAMREQAQKAVAADLENLSQAAQAHGLQLVQGQDGAFRLLRAQDPRSAPAAPIDPQTEREMAAALSRVQVQAVTVRASLAAQIQELDRGIAAEVANPMLDVISHDFAAFQGLGRWLTEVRVDIVEAPERFQIQPGGPNDSERPERRYAVNLLVDHGEQSHPSVVLESNPSYENLFGWIEYRQVQGSLQTDFMQIRAGALHRANGGVLVLRAEALAANPLSWVFLKSALRDREIRVEELARTQMPPVSGSPKPRPIPLDVKVVIVGAPRWYATFFEGDPDFRTYFKVSADIDSDMAANTRNLGLYAGLIEQMAARHGFQGATEGAVTELLRIASRWAERHDKLSARVELVEDIVAEATVPAQANGQRALTEEAVITAYDARRRRNARIEERVLQSIVEGAMMIDTRGTAIGQINALTVNTAGDHRFGTPTRVTARGYAGRAGIVNIERDVGMGGPIQQKGAMVLEGYLAGRFAQTRPLSFTCSITFEQVYGGVEGDSASMAELIAVLSDLAQLPIRQDLAITGSVNQEGISQPIGGAHWKIEGFYRVCAAKPGGLTGTQGVIVPNSNRVNLVLHDDVAAAIAAGRFHLWSVETVDDAAELLLGVPTGKLDAAGNYAADTIFGRVAAKLDAFDRILVDRIPTLPT
jgi:predicted ATP-dependent protease